MPVRLVALDIDSTLTDSNQKLAERTIAAAHTARAAGLRLVLATGRRFEYAFPIAEALGFAPDDVLITSTGTVVRQFDGTLLARTFLDRATALELASVLTGHHRETLVYTFDDVDDAPHGQTPHSSLMIENIASLKRVIPRWVDHNLPDIAEVVPIERGLEGREPIQAMVCGTVEGMREVYDYLTALPVGERLNVLATEYLDRDLGFMDLLPAGVGKGLALRNYAASLGIPAEDVAAIGDNHNDLDMLHYAGRAFVVANASPRVLELAGAAGWAILPSNDECGAAELLEALAAEALTGVR